MRAQRRRDRSRRPRPGLAAITADMLDEGAGGKDALALADAIDFLGADGRHRRRLGRLDGAPARARWRAWSRRCRSWPTWPCGPTSRRPRWSACASARSPSCSRRGPCPARWRPARWRRPSSAQHRYGMPLERHRRRPLRAARGGPARVPRGSTTSRATRSLVVVGDVTPAVLPLLEKAFGGWPGGEAPRRRAWPCRRQVKGRSHRAHRQAGARPSPCCASGRVGPRAARSADCHALEVMNTLLGGSFTSRLNDNLREQHGYAYGAGSSFGYRQVGGRVPGRGRRADPVHLRGPHARC